MSDEVARCRSIIIIALYIISARMYGWYIYHHESRWCHFRSSTIAKRKISVICHTFLWYDYFAACWQGTAHRAAENMEASPTKVKAKQNAVMYQSTKPIFGIRWERYNISDIQRINDMEAHSIDMSSFAPQLRRDENMIITMQPRRRK